MKHYLWLKSIRVLTNNGYLCDEDCHRIEKYFKEQIKIVVDRVWENENYPLKKYNPKTGEVK
jgi:hypothetical protein